MAYKYTYVGKRIFFLKDNGTVICTIGEMEGGVVEPPKEHEEALKQAYEYYSELKGYNKEVVEFIDLEFGEFKTEFAECTSYRVNVDTKQLEFDYTPIPEPPDVPHTPTVHERLDALEQVNAEQDMLIMEMSGLMV